MSEVPPAEHSPEATVGLPATPDPIGGATVAPAEPERLSGPLVGLLGGHLGGLGVAEKNKQRVYVGTLETKMRLGGKNSVTSSTTAFKIETIKGLSDKLAGDYGGKGGVMLDQEFMLEKKLAEAADKRIDTRRGNVAISANYVRNDHSKIIERLAAAVARYSQYGALSWALLSSGRDDVHNRDKVDGRIEHGSNLIYVPRVSADHGESLAWYAVIGAALGCGNKVVTDATATDNNNRVVLNAPSNRELAMGCMEALSRIGNYYARSDAAVLFAWAFFKGVATELSMVGMTDEGAYIRSVVRRNRFVTPYGVIWVSGDRLACLPVAPFVDRASAARFVDSVLMYGAASSALSDPLVKIGDHYYPSVFTAGITHSTITPAPKLSEEEEADYALELGKRIYDACGAYCENYARMLDRMLMGNSADIYLDKVSGFLVANFASKTSSADRHLRARVVAPYYWIEPQGIMGPECSDMMAQKHGFGVYAYRGSEQAHEPWEKISNAGDPSAALGGYYCEFTAARKNLMILHLLNNREDGLAYIIPRQTREDGLTLVGHRGNRGSFVVRAQDVDSLDTYLWRHATNHLIAPAEMLQLTPGLMFMVFFARLDTDTYTYDRMFQGDPGDFTNQITAKSIQIQGHGLRDRDSPFTRNIVRNVSLAAAALDTNRSLVGRIGDAFTVMPISNTGAGPGVNQAIVSWQDPRRLVLSGDDPDSVWTKVVGKVQTTVVSHKLRHGKKSQKDAQVFEADPGPVIEGGEPAVALGTVEAPVEVLEIAERYSAITDVTELIECSSKEPLLKHPEEYDWASAVDYLKDAFGPDGKLTITEATYFHHDKDTKRMNEQLLYGPALNALILMSANYDEKKMDEKQKEKSNSMAEVWNANFGAKANPRGILMATAAWSAMYSLGLTSLDPQGIAQLFESEDEKLERAIRAADQDSVDESDDEGDTETEADAAMASDDDDDD